MKTIDDDIEDSNSWFWAAMGWLMGLVVVCLGLAWLVQGNDFFLAKVFSPKMEAVRRETFEESKAYNDGMAQELDAMRFDYLKAKPEQQAALASVILHRAAAYDVAKLPPDLRAFVEKLRASQGAP